jgi:hypothetical protein
MYTPVKDSSGNLVRLRHEAVLYDEEAFVDPVRIVHYLDKLHGLNDDEPFPMIECTASIFPVDGFATPLSPGRTFDYTVPDIFGRPWAQIWERYHEQGMDRPVEVGPFGL